MAYPFRIHEDQAVSSLDMAQVLRIHAEPYCKEFPVSLHRRRIIRDIMECRTPVMGGKIEECDSCGKTRKVYHSCRNRHCPRCQSERARQWVEKRKSEVLPVRYYHLVFTVPDILRPLIKTDKRKCLSLLFRAARETLVTISADPVHIGAITGGIMLLHTWSNTLDFHPHIHCIVPAGGISPDKTRWIVSSKKDFFLPVGVLSAMFRGKYLDFLKKALKNHQNPAFGKAIRNAYEKKWNVFAKRPFAGPETVIDYLGRYTHRIAISDRRILAVDDQTVTFEYTDRKDEYRKKEITLPGKIFAHRFLQHVLPPGFMKIRYFGFMASRNKTESLSLIRRLLSGDPEKQISKKTDDKDCSDQDYTLCPFCSAGHMKAIGPIPAQPRSLLLCRDP